MADSDIDEMLSQYGESRPTERAPRPTLGSKLWDNRPWKSHVGNAPSLADQVPYLAFIAGLLHPRLGGATRDLSMARQLATMGDKPAAMESALYQHPFSQTTARSGHVETYNKTGNVLTGLEPGTIPPIRGGTANRDQLFGPPRLAADRAAPMRGEAANANTPQPSPYRQGSPVAAYETYLNGLRPGEEPMSYWRFVREVLGQ